MDRPRATNSSGPFSQRGRPPRRRAAASKASTGAPSCWTAAPSGGAGASSALATDLRALGEPERARRLDEHTLERRRRALGDDHPDTLRSATNLAADLAAMGDTERWAAIQAEFELAR